MIVRTHALSQGRFLHTLVSGLSLEIEILLQLFPVDPGATGYLPQGIRPSMFGFDGRPDRLAKVRVASAETYEIVPGLRQGNDPLGPPRTSIAS
jgi:hypothetical protein